MPAFAYNRTEQIKMILARLASRLVNSIRNDLTVTDIFEAYTKPEDRETLTRIHSLVSLSGMSNTISHRYDRNYQLGIFLEFGESDPRWVVPNYTNDGPQVPCPKVDKWAAKRMKTGRDMGLAFAAFQAINDACSSPTALAFLMPSATALVGLIEESDPKKHEALSKLHDRMSNPKLPALPFLKPEITEAAREAGPLIAKALLLEKKFEETQPAPVRLVMSGSADSRTPWGTTMTFM